MFVERHLPIFFGKPVNLIPLYKTEIDGFHPIPEHNDNNNVHIFLVHESVFKTFSEDVNIITLEKDYHKLSLCFYQGNYFMSYDAMDLLLISGDLMTNNLYITNAFLEHFTTMDLLMAFCKLLKLSDDNIEEIKIKIIKINEEQNIELAIQNFTSSYVKTLESIQIEYNSLTRSNNQLRAKIAKNNQSLTTLVEQYVEFNKPRFFEAMREEMSKITNHPKVSMVDVNGNYFEIHTNDLYMYEPINKTKHYLGRMMIKLPFVFDENSNIKLLNLNNKRNGFWSGCNHPHVNSGGDACFGNIDVQIIELYAQFKYFDLFMLMLNYLQTANIEDSAGKSISAYDIVDENNVVIQKGIKWHNGRPETNNDEVPIVATEPEIAIQPQELHNGNGFGFDWLDVAIRNLTNIEGEIQNGDI